MFLLDVTLAIFTFPAILFLEMFYADKFQQCWFPILPFTNLIHILHKLSSLGKEKTVVRSSLGKVKRQSTTQHL